MLSALDILWTTGSRWNGVPDESVWGGAGDAALITNSLEFLTQQAGSQITLWIAGGYSQPMSYCLAKWTFMKWIRVSGQGYHNQVWPERPLSPVAFDSNSFLFYHLTLIIYCLMLLVTMLCCLIFQTKLKVPRVEEPSCITFCIIAPILNFHLLTD